MRRVREGWACAAREGWACAARAGGMGVCGECGRDGRVRRVRSVWSAGELAAKEKELHEDYGGCHGEPARGTKYRSVSDRLWSGAPLGCVRAVS